MYSTHNDWHDDVFRLTGGEGLSLWNHWQNLTALQNHDSAIRWSGLRTNYDLNFRNSILCALCVSE
jgi:hypothetical protein